MILREAPFRVGNSGDGEPGRLGEREQLGLEVARAAAGDDHGAPPRREPRGERGRRRLERRGVARLRRARQRVERRAAQAEGRVRQQGHVAADLQEHRLAVRQRLGQRLVDQVARVAVFVCFGVLFRLCV